MNEQFKSWDEMIDCVKRELSMRKRLYPRWVAEERISQQKAEHEIACMATILDHLLQASGRREERLL
jgi:ribulose kinase